MPKKLKVMTRGELARHVGDLIEGDRNEAHGDPVPQFRMAQKIKTMTRAASGGTLSAVKQESLDMVATKISRICHGNSSVRDHWLDIAGYALIAAETCDE